MLKLVFFRDQLHAGSEHTFDAAVPRAIYTRVGAPTIRAAGVLATLAPNAAWHGSVGTVRVVVGKTDAEIYRWELHRDAVPSGATMVSELSIDAKQAWLMRCDRVDFPLGGVALTHTHQGPGIRCLLNGALKVASAGHELNIKPGEPWFESGPDPVLANASETELTAFARVMILPAALLGGKTSISYVLPEDRDKPKRQTYQLFVDEPIATA